MTESSNAAEKNYQPESINVPPLFALPWRPLLAIKWLLWDLMVPWGVLWIAVAVLIWSFLTPEMARMEQLSLGWIGLIWLRNAAVLTVIAGGLHWWFYMYRGQEMQTKFTRKWLVRDDAQFLWRDQVKDNMFWSLVSGVTIWTGYESLTYWWYANGFIISPSFVDAPIYTISMLWGVFFWSTFHFYLNHRALHWKPLYDLAHELHHRNTNTGPWTGISMHPIEHLIYFTVFLLWWVVPVHPVIIVLTGLFQGVSPSISHSGFDYLKVGRFQLSTGDNFHNLHHRYFHINYGNIPMPLDWVFNSWHDGAEAGKAVLRSRMRARGRVN